MGCTKEPTVEFANTPAPQLIHGPGLESEPSDSPLCGTWLVRPGACFPRRR